MSVAFDHREPGTDEAHWREAAPWRDAPDLDLDIDRLVVLAAHPDDETLGAGGLIARAARAGAEVVVIVATDGEASDPVSSDPAHLGRLRREESIRALDRLAPGTPIVFLAAPDGAVREERARISEVLTALVRAGDPRRTLLAAPWWGDGHRDHRVAGEIATALAGSGVRVIGYPIWLWHWGRPDDVDPSGWRVLPLDPATTAAKAEAIAQHVTQLHPRRGADDGPMLHANTVAHFTRDVEVFIETAPPAVAERLDFEAFHARHEDPWGLDSRWYERRKRALLLAALPRDRFTRVLELGCATGATTAQLAARADAVLAVDISPTALRRARERGLPHSVTWRRADLPHEWPDGRFDLVVLSELGYYWSPAELAEALDRIDGSMDPDGILVACHWRHPIPDARQTGDAVHAAIAARTGWRMLARHVEDDFLLEVFARPDAPSVATEAGLTP